MSRYAEQAPGSGLLAVLYRRSSLAVIGALAAAVLVAMLGLSIAYFNHAFADTAPVTLDVSRAGSQLSTGADVKLHGIVVGRVAAVTADTGGGGARLHLALDSNQLQLIPRNVTAQVLPKTLFGEKYVDLELPSRPTTRRLAAGDVIAQSHTKVAIEMRTVLNNLEPLLAAVKPADLNTALTAVATAVQGRGRQLGRTIDSAAAYAAGAKGSVDDFVTDARLLGAVSNAYADQAGHTLHTLANLTISGQTLTMKRAQLARLLASTDKVATTATTFTAHVGSELVQVSRVSRPLLNLYARYSPELSCTVVAADKAIARLSASYDAGPYMKAHYFVVLSRGEYVHGKDDPRPVDLSGYGPYCPVTPSGGRLTVPHAALPAPLQFLEGTASLANNLGASSAVPLGSTTPSATDGTPAGSGAAAPDLLQMLLGPVMG